MEADETYFGWQDNPQPAKARRGRPYTKGGKSGPSGKRAGVNLNKAKLGKGANDDRADWREAWALFPGSVAYVWHAGRHASTVQESLEATGFEVRSQIIWAKDRFALSRGHYHWQHEPCWYAVRGTAAWHGDRKQSTLWQIAARDDHGHGHGTQKPVECMTPPDREQLLARPGDLRAVLRLRHDHHRGRDHRPLLPRHRTDAAIRRCRGRALAGLHRRSGQARRGWSDVCRNYQRTTGFNAWEAHTARKRASRRRTLADRRW